MGLSNELSLRLGVSPTSSTPANFYRQRFWGFIFLHWNPGLRGLSHSPVVPYGLSANVGLPAAALLCVISAPAAHILPLLPVWMNISSFTPWLDFQFASLIFWLFWFFCFVLFLNSLSFFWFCEDAKCICLYLHFGQKSLLLLLFLFYNCIQLPMGNQHSCENLIKFIVLITSFIFLLFSSRLKTLMLVVWFSGYWLFFYMSYKWNFVLSVIEFCSHWYLR